MMLALFSHGAPAVLAAAGGHPLDERAIERPLGAAVVCLHGRHASKEATLSIVQNLVVPLRADLLAINVEVEVGPGFTNLARTVAVDELRNTLNSSGSLVGLVPADDPSDEQRLSDTKQGSWGVFQPGLRNRIYMDLSGRLQCASMVRAYEQASGKKFTTVVHSRSDFLMFDRLPDSIAQGWRRQAESEPAVPHIFKPEGEDSMGIIDFLAISNVAGNAVENGVRDAITAGTAIPFNTDIQKFAMLRPLSNPSAPKYPEDAGADRLLEAAGDFPMIFPEQMTAGHLVSHGVRLVREKWPMCRIDSDSGSCRYPGEVSRLLNESLSLVQQNARSVCGALSPYSAKMLADGCCTARAGSPLLQATGLFSSECPPRMLRGTATCLHDYDDECCCGAASQCAQLLAASDR